MVPNAEARFLAAALALTPAISLTFASIELPKISNRSLADVFDVRQEPARDAAERLDLSPGIGSGRDPEGPEAFFRHDHVRPIDDTCLAVVAVLIGRGSIIDSRMALALDGFAMRSGSERELHGEATISRSSIGVSMFRSPRARSAKREDASSFRRAVRRGVEDEPGNAFAGESGPSEASRVAIPGMFPVSLPDDVNREAGAALLEIDAFHFRCSSMDGCEWWFESHRRSVFFDLDRVGFCGAETGFQIYADRENLRRSRPFVWSCPGPPRDTWRSSRSGGRASRVCERFAFVAA
jgi:hypothetical protein